MTQNSKDFFSDVVFFLSVSFNFTDVCLFFGIIWLLKDGVSIRLKYSYCKCFSFIQVKLRCFVHFFFFYLTNNQFCHVSDQHNYWAPCQTLFIYPTVVTRSLSRYFDSRWEQSLIYLTEQGSKRKRQPSYPSHRNQTRLEADYLSYVR